MAGSLNKVMLIGNLGVDPETRYSGSGTAVCNLRIATSSKWKDKDGEKQERTEWHQLVAFGKLAEICGEYLGKGDSIYVEGENRTEKYTDKDGVERWSTKVYINEMKMLSTKDKDHKAENNRQQDTHNQKAPPEQATFDDDDIPF